MAKPVDPGLGQHKVADTEASVVDQAALVAAPVASKAVDSLGRRKVVVEVVAACSLLEEFAVVYKLGVEELDTAGTAEIVEAVDSLAAEGQEAKVLAIPWEAVVEELGSQQEHEVVVVVWDSLGKVAALVERVEMHC